MVSAYACEPGLGSEIGVGWHWVVQLSRRYELWVLTRASNRATIEAVTAGSTQWGGVHFVYYDLPRRARFWKRGLRGVRTYYMLWQMMANRLVRKTMQEHDIHTFMHLTYGNVMWRVSRYGSRQSFIWGPVGGLETIPDDYSRHYGLRSRLTEAVRRGLVWLTRHGLGFRGRCRRADLILCKTGYTLRGIPARYRHKAVMMTDVAAEQMERGGPLAPRSERRPERGGALAPRSERRPERGGALAPRSCRRSSEYCSWGGREGAAPLPTEGAAPLPHIHFICVGRLDAWRGFDLAIEALAQMADKRARLVIVGKGPDRERLVKLADSLGVADRVTFTGKVGMDEYYALMQQADVVLNPALKEGAVTVSFDALSMGKPLIGIDTEGYTRYFTDEYSVIIPRESRKKVVPLLAEAMDRLTSAELRERMGERAREAASRLTWAAHGDEILSTIAPYVK